MPEGPTRTSRPPTYNGYRELMHEGFARGAGGAAPGATIALELDNGPTAAAEARAAVGVLDGKTDRDLLDDVRLLVSEIVTNAVRHSGSPAGSKVGLRVSATRARVRVEVTDAGVGFEPRPRTADQEKGSGWGLHLVDRLAARWGVDRTRPPRVWFELESSPS